MFRTSTVLRCMCVPIVALLVGTTGVSSAPAVSHDRIVHPIDETQLVALRGHVRRQARSEFDVGRVNGTSILHRVAMVFRPSPEQQQALETLLAEQQDPHSPNYHQWLTPEQYGERFGMSPGDLAKVSAWLQSKGFNVEGASRGRTEIFFTGTVARVEQDFHTEIHQYHVNGEMHFANATEPSLPAAFGNAILGIRNLDDFRPRARSRLREVARSGISPHYTNSVGMHFLAPQDFATIYHVTPLYNQGINGSGQKIAVVGDSAITLNDIAAFRTASALAQNTPQVVTVPGTGTATHNSAEGEADLDVEWSGAVAPGAHIIYVVAGPTASGGAFDALHYAVNNPDVVGTIISNSFGACEADEKKNNALVLQGWAQQANTEGQTITSASGDAGSADCDGDAPTTPAKASKGISVDVPAAIPEVTGVGGSEFFGDNSSVTDTQYWSGTNSSGGGSAKQPIPEQVWNDTLARGTLAAGGGGKSTFFSRPPFQDVVQTVVGTARGVPDVSLNASPDHDGYLTCTLGSCTKGTFANNSKVVVVGGTSAGAPAFAGILALINQATNSSQGNANTTLYLASTQGSFHDITTGDNKVPCNPGTPSCPTSSPFEYACCSAGPGYDLASGWGSVDADALVTSWPGFTPLPNFSLGANPDPMTISSAGASGTSAITINPTNGFTGTVNLSCTPPASATSEVGCSISPSSVMVTTSSATATVTVTTAAPHAVASQIVSPGFGLGATLFTAGMVVLAIPSGRSRRLLSFGVLVLLAVGAACGGSSSTPPQPKDPGTPAGSYLITVTGTSGSLSNQENVTVTVK
jgi:subtilase family serine protease